MGIGEAEKKIGVLGGTFDPVHRGHLAVARFVKEKLALQEILFIPACRPPHKNETLITPFPLRLAMLRLAVRSEPGFAVSDVEAARSGPSYSVDTLAELQTQYGPGVRFSFIIGLDAFLDLHTWKNFRRLPHLADLVVINRADYPLESFSRMVGRLGPYAFGPARSCWLAREIPGVVNLLDMVPVEISSTMVRQAAGVSAPLTQLVTPEVAAYIAEQHLYSGVAS